MAGINNNTLQVLEDIKAGKGSPEKYFSKRDWLKKRGVDTESIDFALAHSGIINPKEHNLQTFDKYLMTLPEETRALTKEKYGKKIQNQVIKGQAHGLITAAELATGVIAPYATPLAIGPGEFLRGKVEGQPTGTALKRGATAAGVDAVLTLGTFGIGKLLGMGGKALSGVPEWASKAVKGKPSLLTKTIKPLINIGDDVVEAMKVFSRKSKDAYNAAISKLNIKGTKMVPLSGVHSKIGSYGMDKKVLASKLKAQARRQLMDVSDDAIDTFAGINKINALPFDDAKNINSLLHDVVGGQPIEALGGGAISRLGGVKKSLLDSMDEAIPGIRNINKKYALRTSFQDKTLKAVAKSGGDIKEGALGSIGEELAGAAKKKSVEAARLRALQKYTPEVPFLETLKEKVTKGAFEKGKGIMSKSLVGGGVGTYLAGRGAGGGEESPLSALPKLLAGAAIGATVLPVLGSPGAVKAGIMASKYLPKLLAPVRGQVSGKAADLLWGE